MAWKLFTETKGKFSSRASISSNGFISFTKGAALQFGVKKETDKFAKLYYDGEENFVGVKFFNTAEEHTVKVMFRDDSGFSVSAKGFLKFFKILPEKTSFYSIKKEENSEMIIIDLNTAKERKIGEKRKKDMTQISSVS